MLCVCEVLPKSRDHNVSSFIIGGYASYQCLEGRGVCIFVKNDIDVTIIELEEVTSLFKPSLFLKVISSKCSFVLGIVYRSPSCQEEENDKINTQIDSAIKHLKSQSEHLILLGDFNYPEISWEDETCSHAPSHKSADSFLENFHFNDLSQLVTEPTHHRAMQTPTLIDLLITDDPMFIKNICFYPPFGMSHHSVICFEVNINVHNVSKEGVYKLQVNKGRYDEFRKYLSEKKWVVTGDDVDIMWEDIFKSLKTGESKFVPKKLIKTGGPKRRSCPWSPGLLHRIHMKRVAFKNYKRHPTISNYKLYCKYRNQVKWESRKSVKSKEKRIAQQIKTNPKLFYQYVSSKIKGRENISNLLKDDGTLTENDQQKAEVLKTFFHSVFTDDSNQNDMPVFEPRTQKLLSHIEVSEDQMERALKSLKIDKSPGPDGLHPRVLKEVATEIAKPLTILFNTTIRTGKIPKAWKVAEVRPLFKKGNKTSPGNYCPVSLTAIVCKLFESFVREALYNHLVDNKLLSIHQFGFCKGRSCISQLLVTIHNWISCMDRDIPTDAIYLDLSKAFDTVPHKKLIHKLKGYGIGGSILNWITDFLSDRTQYVSVNGSCSGETPVTSGVPQGSVLGPVLFIFYINDMPDVVETFLKIFADDTKTSNQISCYEDSIVLQKSIDSLCCWSDSWDVTFNCDKCGVMHLGKNNPGYNYNMNGKVLNETKSEKDLGVYVDPLLNFEEHMNITVKKARRLSGLIIRNISCKSKDIMVPLFKSLVRPILEYGNVVWSPYTRKYIDFIENVQRPFSKCIVGVKNLEYPERLKFLNLPSLEYRRLRGDLIEAYKICHGLYDSSTTSSLFDMSSEDRTRTNGKKIYKINTNHSKFHHFLLTELLMSGMVYLHMLWGLSL